MHVHGFQAPLEFLKLRPEALTAFEDVYEAHEQRAQLLAVEGVLLLCDVHLHLPAGDVVQQHADQLQQEPGARKPGTSVTRKLGG